MDHPNDRPDVTPKIGTLKPIANAAPNPPPDPGIILKLPPEHPVWWKKFSGMYADHTIGWLGWIEDIDAHTSWVGFVTNDGTGLLFYRDANKKIVGDAYGFSRPDLAAAPYADR